MAISWLQGKHAYRVETQASKHKASKEQKDRSSERQKTSKDNKGVSIACNPVDVAEPVVPHINSTSYSRRSYEHRKHKRCILLLRQKKRQVDDMNA